MHSRSRNNFILVTIGFLGVAVFTMASMHMTGVSDYSRYAAQITGQEKPVTISASPSSDVYAVGDTFSVDVRVDTAGRGAVTATAHIAFDSRVVGVIGIDMLSSDFPLAMGEKMAGNEVMITRGAAAPGVTSDGALVARVTFYAINPGVARITPRLVHEDGVSQVITAGSGGVNALEEGAGAKVVVALNNTQKQFLVASDTSSVTNGSVIPPVRILAPKGDEVLSGVVPVETNVAEANGSQNNVRRVEFLLNGRVFAVRSSPPYGLLWNTAAVPNGTYALRAVVHTDEGNRRTSPPVFASVKNARSLNMNEGLVASQYTVTATVLSDDYNRIEVTEGVRVRSEPSLSAPDVAVQQSGARGTALGDVSAADGHSWIRIQYDDGTVGWSATGWVRGVSDDAGSTQHADIAPPDTDVRSTADRIAELEARVQELEAMITQLIEQQ